MRTILICGPRLLARSERLR